ncbi:MAG: DUF4395 domain-containing protein, partial [Actinomycetota bacterium]|nr:DUF4395 domain-containing protein [Actinomycetota bacterium]
MSEAGRIDPRGPRFAAAITSLLLLIVVFLGLVGLPTARTFGWFAYQPLSGATLTWDTWAIVGASLAQRALDPAFLLLAVVAILFLWGVVSPRTAPWGV